MDSPGVPWGCTAPLEMGKPQGFLTRAAPPAGPVAFLAHPPTQRSLLLGALGSRHETGSPEASTGAHSSPLPRLCAGPATPDPSGESPNPYPLPIPPRAGTQCKRHLRKPPLLLSVECVCLAGSGHQVLPPSSSPGPTQSSPRHVTAQKHRPSSVRLGCISGLIPGQGMVNGWSRPRPQMGGPHGIRAPRAEVPLHRAKPQVCVGLVSGPSRWVHLGAAPGKGLARFWNLLPACPPPQGPALYHLVIRAYFAVPAWGVLSGSQWR